MNIWLTSDPHWHHRKVSEIRGFDTPEEHDDALLGEYVDYIRPNDRTWWLGDLTATSPQPGFEAIAKIPGKHHLVWGNHDNGHPMHRDSYRRQDRYRPYFESMQAFIRRRAAGREYLMCHFPYAGDHTEVQRYDQYRLPDLGTPLVHGHTHSTEAISFTERGTLQVHVGVDAWFRPVNLDEVIELFNEHITEERQ